MAFVYESLPFLGELGQVLHSKIVVARQRKPQNPREKLFFLSTKGRTAYWDVKIPADAFLCFGAEGFGLPKEFYEIYKDRLFTIPMTGPVRSLNLSSSAAIVLFETLRQNRP